jgi:hypothetical protein
MMSYLLTIIMCSGLANQCLQPFTFPTQYPNSYTCMVEGYKKAMEKTIDIGAEEVNKHQIYIKFDCSLFIIPPQKPKVET